MNILDKIIAHKKEEIAQKKQQATESQLQTTPLFNSKTWSLVEALKQKNNSGIIAEFKRKSPSKGNINLKADAASITKAYTENGAAGLSILTDNLFFGGQYQDVTEARANAIPILRKDFMIDPYQITEAKAMGADVILLIAACLTPTQTRSMAAFAKQLNLEVLLEIHTPNELHHICDEIDMVGINNRNLKTFEVNWQHAIALANSLPCNKLKIAESGIQDVDTLLMLQQQGFDGFLIGETFMKQNNPAIAFANFVTELKQKQHEGKSLRTNRH